MKGTIHNLRPTSASFNYQILRKACNRNFH